MRFRLPGSVVGAEAQIFIELVRRLSGQTNQFAGIHFPVRVPCGFKFAESLHQFRTEHFRQQFGAGLSVAVFAGERPAVTDHKVGGFFYELSEFGDSGFRLQIEVQTCVDAGVAEVAVERAAVAECGHHLSQVAEIAAELFGSDGGVFPAFPVQRLAGHMRGDAEAGLANFPHTLGLRAGVDVRVRRTRAALQRLDHGAGLGFGMLRGICAELDQQPSAAFGQ